MKRRSPLRWAHGAALELLGVGVILWVAAGAPLPATFSSPATPPSPTSGTAMRADIAVAHSAQDPWARWQLDSLLPDSLLPESLLPESLLPPAAPERAEFTENRLRKAGDSLLALAQDMVAVLLPDPDQAGRPRSPHANEDYRCCW